MEAGNSGPIDLPLSPFPFLARPPTGQPGEDCCRFRWPALDHHLAGYYMKLRLTLCPDQQIFTCVKFLAEMLKSWTCQTGPRPVVPSSGASLGLAIVGFHACPSRMPTITGLIRPVSSVVRCTTIVTKRPGFAPGRLALEINFSGLHSPSAWSRL